jgi:hypothetical protein
MIKDDAQREMSSYRKEMEDLTLNPFRRAGRHQREISLYIDEVGRHRREISHMPEGYVGRADDEKLLPCLNMERSDRRPLPKSSENRNFARLS